MKNILTLPYSAAKPLSPAQPLAATVAAIEGGVDVLATLGVNLVAYGTLDNLDVSILG